MKRVEDVAKDSYPMFGTLNAGTVNERAEEPKPEVTSRAEDDVPISTQAVEEISDDEPQVTALPVLHGNVAVDHNGAVQAAHETEAMLEDESPVDTSLLNEPAWIAARREIQDLLERWAKGEAEGEGREQEFKRASEMAEHGDPVAMYQLREMMVGDAFNTPSAQQKRFKLLVDAANKGWVPAYEALALYCQFNVGDMITAAKCYGAIEAYWPFIQQQAGQEGWLPPMQKITEIPELNIRGVQSQESPASNVHAFMWQVRLAREGSPAAMRKVAAKLLAEPFDEARAKRACTWLDSAAAAGDAKAMLALGMMFEHGIGVAQDRARALSLYQQAAEKGLADAQMKLSSLYAQHQNASEWRAAGLITDGKGTGAYEWCLRAAKQGSLEAKLQIAQMLATGNGVAKDVKAAFTLCKEAADAGLDEAYLPLVLMYVTGTGTEQDDDEARYYDLSGRLYDFDGAYWLASIYEGNFEEALDTAQRFGMRLDVNRKRAFAWFRESGWEMMGSDADKKVKELVAAGDGAFIDENEAREWDRYEEWFEDWREIEFPSDDTLAPEEVRQLVDRGIRTGPWKPSGGECINLANHSGASGAINWIKYLPQALREAPRLRHLNLEDNHLTDDRADHIATLIRETRTLEVLNLGGNKFTASGYRTIAAAMQDNFTLRRVHTDAKFNSEESRLIRSLCLRNRNLQKLQAEFKWPSPLASMTVPSEISELLEQQLIIQDQKGATESASATRQRVLEMLMCLQPMVLQPRVLQTRNPQPKVPQTTADARTS